MAGAIMNTLWNSRMCLHVVDRMRSVTESAETSKARSDAISGCLAQQNYFSFSGVALK